MSYRRKNRKGELRDGQRREREILYGTEVEDDGSSRQFTAGAISDSYIPNLPPSCV